MDLIESIRTTHLTPEVIQKASVLLGESPSSTRRALETAVSTVVAALAAQTSSPTGAHTWYASSRRPACEDRGGSSRSGSARAAARI